MSHDAQNKKLELNGADTFASSCFLTEAIPLALVTSVDCVESPEGGKKPRKRARQFKKILQQK